jgi:hypothetical protein
MKKTLIFTIASLSMIKCTQPHQIKEKRQSFVFGKHVDLNLTELPNKKRLFYEQLEQSK